MSGSANISAAPKNFSAKIMIYSSVGTILVFADVLYFLYIQHHRPHVPDAAAGFVTRFSYKGVIYYLSQTDVVILAGLLGAAVVSMVSFQVYLWKVRRKTAKPLERRR